MLINSTVKTVQVIVVVIITFAEQVMRSGLFIRLIVRDWVGEDNSRKDEDGFWWNFL